MWSKLFMTLRVYGSGKALLVVLTLLVVGTDGALAQRPSPPVGPAQLYFVAIGSEDFAFTKPAYPKGFDAVAAPEHSATRVADALIASGARYGILLTSDRKGAPGKRWVTRDDVVKAVLDVKARIRKDKAQTPRIVSYIMSHGLGDGVGRQLIMVPGNLVPTDASQSFMSQLQWQGIWQHDIVGALVNFRTDPRMQYMDDIFPSRLPLNPFDQFRRTERQQNERRLEEKIADIFSKDPTFKDLRNPPVPFAAMFDNCYGAILGDLVNEKTPGGKFLSPLGSAIIDGQLRQLENDALVLYAAKPGGKAGDYPDPDRPYDHMSPETTPKVGLLAARLLLALRDRERRPMTLGTLATKFSQALPPTRPDGGENPPLPYSISPTNPDVARTEFLPLDTSRRGQLDRRYGTGTTIETCCR